MIVQCVLFYKGAESKLHEFQTHFAISNIKYLYFLLTDSFILFIFFITQGSLSKLGKTRHRRAQVSHVNNSRSNPNNVPNIRRNGLSRQSAFRPQGFGDKKLSRWGSTHCENWRLWHV